MEKARLIIFFLLLSGISFSCWQKEQGGDSSNVRKRTGGSCEGCEAVYESAVEFDKLGHTDTLPDFNEAGPKLKLSGVVYKNDGETPAPGVVIYVYHTDQKGHYSSKDNETGWGRRHGYIRGWVKTNDNGEYVFYTLKPAPYPGGNAPAHIHAIVKEPDVNEYYIDDVVFEGDKNVDEQYRGMAHNRGGSGIIKPEETADMLVGKRDIILGKNIQDY